MSFAPAGGEPVPLHQGWLWRVGRCRRVGAWPEGVRLGVLRYMCMIALYCGQEGHGTAGEVRHRSTTSAKMGGSCDCAVLRCVFFVVFWEGAAGIKGAPCWPLPVGERGEMSLERGQIRDRCCAPLAPPAATVPGPLQQPDLRHPARRLGAACQPGGERGRGSCCGPGAGARASGVRGRRRCQGGEGAACGAQPASRE